MNLSPLSGALQFSPCKVDHGQGAQPVCRSRGVQLVTDPKTSGHSIGCTVQERVRSLQARATLSAFDTLPGSAYVPLPVVCALFGWSPATVWRRVRAGILVPPHRLGLRTTRWNVGELRLVLANIGPTGTPSDGPLGAGG